MLLYNQLEWKNMEGVKSKLKIIKNERKEDEIKEAKKKKKEEALKRQGGVLEKSDKKIEEEVAQDDLFEG